MAKFKAGDVIVTDQSVPSFLKELYVIYVSEKGGNISYRVEDMDGDMMQSVSLSATIEKYYKLKDE